MRLAKHLLRTTVLITISASFLACQDSRARIALTKAQNMQNEIADFDGPDHAPQEIQQLQTLISDATTRLDSGQTSEGFDLANQARELATRTLAQVEQAEAQDSWTQALRSIQIGDTNNLRSRNPEIYRNIEAQLQEGEKHRVDAKYREIIRVSRLIMQNVQTGIQPVRDEAERAQFDANQKLRELKQQQAQKYDPVSIVNVQDAINNGEAMFNDRSDFLAATSAFEEASNLAEQGLNNVKRAKGEEQIKTIEELVAVAFDEGAVRFMPDAYNQLIEDFRRMILDFNEGRFSRVNNAAEQILPRAELLKVDTKREAADDRILQMRNAIDDLVEAGVEQYRSGRTQPLEQIVSKARTTRQENTEAAFDSVKEQFGEFNTQKERVIEDFRSLTEDELAQARESLSKTSAVFATAKGILTRDITTVPEDMAPFIERKNALRAELEANINDSNTQLQSAEARLGEEKYSTAIEMSRAQKRRAEVLLENIYEVVSGSAVIELSNLISRYEREGARLYAAAELERSLTELDAVKAARQEPNYFKASELAAAARANIELMEQRISGRAVENIADAEATLQKVSGDKTQKYSADILVQVKQRIDDAKSELQAENLKLALEYADEAKSLSEAAFEQANRLAATDALEAARVQIATAETAKAPLYAGRLMETSRQLFGQASKLQANGSFEKAEELALLSRERAEQALYKRIIDAETAIADAKAVGGWDLQSDSLSKASSNVRISRQLLEQGDYSGSASLASSAESNALSVAQSSRQHNYHEAVRRIQENLDKGTAQGINYFQFGDSVEVRRRLADIQNSWNIDRYDFVMAELNKLERELRGTLDTTDDVVATVASQQEQRLNGLVEIGAEDYAADLVENARKNLKYALVDYNNGLYKSAHSNLNNAITSINTIENRYQMETYTNTVEELFARYESAQTKFRNVLSLSPTEVKALAFGTYSRGNNLAIAGQARPADFRAEVEQIYAEALSLKAPANMIPVHENVLRGLNEGRIAAIRFEKFLILGEASRGEAENLIDTAFVNINTSNQIINDLRQQFFTNEIEFRLVTYSDLARR